MIQLKSGGEALDLPSGFSVSMEDTNPIFNDRGSQSIPATVPATRRNIRILGAPHRIDVGWEPNNPEKEIDVVAGGYMRRGVMNITEAGKKEGITFNVGFGNSAVYAKWQTKKLSELDNLPVYVPSVQSVGGYQIEWTLSYLYRIYQNPSPQTDDFAVFPLAVNKETTEGKYGDNIYWEVLNVVGEAGLHQPSNVNRLIDGEVTNVTVPPGYMVTPFLRVWRILELIFGDLGVYLDSNPFKDDIELARLVVLNNAADSVCRAIIKYADLMPDCTVDEFMNALWVRFGLVYDIDFNTHKVRLKLLRDIIKSNDIEAIDHLVTGSEKITYEERQYIKLSAKTSIEGATPGSERFEDFIKGLDVSQVHQGAHVSSWRQSEVNQRWEGDYYDVVNDYDWDPDYNNPEPPDPDWWDDDRDDDRDDGRDDDRDDDHDDDRDDGRDFDSRAVTSSGKSSSKAKDTFLAREYVTGNWYRLDSTNGTVRNSSTSFFNWDPQTEGLSPLDLSSDDEFVPVERVSTVGTGVGHSYNDMCPVYLVGVRHYHSYIKGGEEGDDNGGQTPLAFMFAYNVGNKTIGRFTPEGDDGKALKLDDGTTPTISLLFQFRDGLFAQFWADYDEILRHGNRTVEVNVRMNKLDVPRWNMFKAFTFKNIRVLVDTLSYSLPSGRTMSVDMKLRTIQPHGKYDIKKEQRIPDFSVSMRHIEWDFVSETYGVGLNTFEVRKLAAQKYINDTNYSPHGGAGDYWYIDAGSVQFKSICKVLPTWDIDTTLPTVKYTGQQISKFYKAELIYNVFESHDLSLGPEEENRVQFAQLLAEVSVMVDYEVKLQSVWVND